MEEIWKDIKDYEGLYQVSNKGRIKALNFKLSGNHRIISQTRGNSNSGYVNLYKDGKRRHLSIRKLVAETFIENKDNCIKIRCKDGNPLNLNADNLEWFAEDKVHKKKIESKNILADGTIEAEKVVDFTANCEPTPQSMLEFLGYNVDEWEIIYFNISVWEQSSKKEGTKNLYAVRYRIKPITPTITPEECVKIARNLFNKNIEPVKLSNIKTNKSLDNDKLMELTGIELHLGKYSWDKETGESYNEEIATERFNHIIKKIVEFQKIEKCGTCLLCIGNDFFNSDTITNTTTSGTPQTNSMRWQQMFRCGLELYVAAIKTLLKIFNRIEVRLQSGNHDKMATFYLYEALSCYFKDINKINFSKNIRVVQSFIFGNSGIFFSHGAGTKNEKQLFKSIASEFYKEWGQTRYRELHLGHLHKEIVVDDNSGLIVRRVGSPSAIDTWHYESRYVGATQKYQVFTWDKISGLQNIRYINF